MLLSLCLSLLVSLVRVFALFVFVFRWFMSSCFVLSLWFASFCAVLVAVCDHFLLNRQPFALIPAVLRV